MSEKIDSVPVPRNLYVGLFKRMTLCVRWFLMLFSVAARLTWRWCGAIRTTMRWSQRVEMRDGAAQAGFLAMRKVAATAVIVGAVSFSAPVRPGWAEARSFGVDVCSTVRNGAVRAGGRVFEPAGGAVLLAGQTVEVRWSRPPEGTGELELLLVADGLTLRLTDELEPDITCYHWRVPDIPTSQAFLVVRFNRGHGEEIAASGAPFHIVGLTLAPRPRARLIDGEWWLKGTGLGTNPLIRALEGIGHLNLPAGFVLALAPEHGQDGFQLRHRAARPNGLPESSTLRSSIHGTVGRAGPNMICQRE